MDKALYYIKAHIGVAPHSSIDVYTHDQDIISAVKAFEAASYIEEFEKSGMWRIHLNPQYTNEDQVLIELKARLDNAKLQDCWGAALDDIIDE